MYENKKIAMFLLIFALIANMLPFNVVTASSTTEISDIPTEITPVETLFWENTMLISCDLGFSGRTVTCTGNIIGYSGSTISATLTLERRSGSSWVFVTSWSKTSSLPFLNFNETHTVSSAGTYRVVLSGIVTRNGRSERVSLISNEKSCN